MQQRDSKMKRGNNRGDSSSSYGIWIYREFTVQLVFILIFDAFAAPKIKLIKFSFLELESSKHQSMQNFSITQRFGEKQSASKTANLAQVFGRSHSRIGHDTFLKHKIIKPKRSAIN